MSLQFLSNDHVRQATSTVLSLASWKSLALVLAFVNLKNLPFVWHVSTSILDLLEYIGDITANGTRSASRTAS